MPDHDIKAIPEKARLFTQRASHEFNLAIDFSEESILKLDGILMKLSSLEDYDFSKMTDSLSCYVGEVIRRNLGGGWVDPQWQNVYIST